MVMGNTTPCWSMVLTRGWLRISTPCCTIASRAACWGARNVCRARFCCRQPPLAARATAALPDGLGRLLIDQQVGVGALGRGEAAQAAQLGDGQLGCRVSAAG